MSTPHAAAVAATTEKDDPTIWLIDDDLWALLEPVLKSTKDRKKAGRPRRDDRAIFDGLVWLARSGSQWSQLPQQVGPTSAVHEYTSSSRRSKTHRAVSDAHIE